MDSFSLVSCVVVLLCSVVCVSSSAWDHRYATGDPVPLFANKIGPYNNPSEIYRYFDLPFCPPAHVTETMESLGEVLNGDRMVKARYELNFREDKQFESLCTRTLSKEDLEKFREAIKKDYYFQMYFDDLPFWGFIGRYDWHEMKYLLFTHIYFDVSYNGDRVIDISATTADKYVLDITEDEEIEVEFLYSVKWSETDRTFERRMLKYTRHMFLSEHLYSITNSCVIVLLLTAFLATILLKVLKNDLMRYSHDEETAEDQEESGWKYIHGDVFRYPPHKSLFCAMIGTGSQLFSIAASILVLGLLGILYPYKKGALFTALVIIYALSAGIAGYTSASFYKQLEGSQWVRNLLLTGFLFCGPLFLTFLFLNFVAIAYNSTAALPFGTIVAIILIWALVSFPLLVIGGIAGKNSKAEFQASCRTSKYSRDIPPSPWYKGVLPQIAVAGLLPFSAIYVELHYVLASIWGFKVYTNYWILSIVFCILLIVTAFTTISLTYFQLAAENHQWWWRSVLCGGSTGLFIFGYCFNYYYARSNMSGFMQTSLFFGYMACICYGVSLMLATVGFRAALIFVRHIYRSIKCE